jgi:hypothetical protein
LKTSLDLRVNELIGFIPNNLGQLDYLSVKRSTKEDKRGQTVNDVTYFTFFLPQFWKKVRAGDSLYFSLTHRAVLIIIFLYQLAHCIAFLAQQVVPHFFI